MADDVGNRILFVPGLRGHVEDHWQTRLASEYPGSVTVPPLNENGLSRKARVANFAQTLQQVDSPVILVAHSAGCLILAHWASEHTDDKVRAALLATPADLETPLPEGYPTADELTAGEWLPVPRARFLFPTILAASRNDPLCAFSAAAKLAMSWGSRLEDLGEVGHLNPAAGYGAWPLGRILTDKLKAQH